MAIELTWVNRTQGADKIEVFRSSEPFTVNTLPEVYSQIEGDAQSFIDRETGPGDVFYYLLKTWRGSEFKYSELIRALGVPYTGPGPQVLLKGDRELGYFGEVPDKDLITKNDLRLIVNLPGNAPATGSSPKDNIWFKFAYKGKILYIAGTPILLNLSWNSIYNKGLVFGVHGPGDPGIANPVDQYFTIKTKDENFIVRCPTITETLDDPPPTNIYNNGAVIYSPSYGMGGSELIELLVAVTGTSFGRKPRLRFDNIASTQVFINEQTEHTARIDTAKNRVFMFGVRNSYIVTMPVLPSSNDYATYPITGTSSSAVFRKCWRPVLEWIEE